MKRGPVNFSIDTKFLSTECTVVRRDWQLDNVSQCCEVFKEEIKLVMSDTNQDRGMQKR